jgi:hypothetical protein
MQAAGGVLPPAIYDEGMKSALPPVPAFGTLEKLAARITITKGGEMKNPLDSLWGTVISGLVITLLLYNVVKYAMH